MKFVIATHNKNKINEFSRILAPLGIEIASAELSEAEETGKTFMENSYIKAKSACDETGLPCIADDSGLCIDQLGGEPGIYSARYAPEGERKRTILKKLEDIPMEKRDAHFSCAICCVFPNGDRVQAEGKCFGKIAFECRGEGGFGYDSIFLYGDKTFAEMSAEEKDEISHRGIALREFSEEIKKYLCEKE